MPKNRFKINSLQSFVYLVVLMIAIILTSIVHYMNPGYYARFLAEMNPLLTLILVGIAGFIAFSTVLLKEQFVIFSKAKFSKKFNYSWLILVFTGVAILVDCRIVFPREMNIPFPVSLLFYPAIAFLVELIFHAIPLAIILALLRIAFKSVEQSQLIWTGIVLVALLEPTFQVAMDDYSIWATVITWINLFLFNLTQLVIFRKYGFISMYIYRLIYYLIWHILWGHVRLDLLF